MNARQNPFFSVSTSGRRCSPTMAISRFAEHGGLTRENGDIFRQKILSRGNSSDLQTLYESWRGAAPQLERC